MGPVSQKTRQLRGSFSSSSQHLNSDRKALEVPSVAFRARHLLVPATREGKSESKRWYVRGKTNEDAEQQCVSGSHAGLDGELVRTR
jgi:hypothetical protein